MSDDRPAIDWYEIEQWYILHPEASYAQCAEKFGVAQRTIEYRAGKVSGDWVRKRKQYHSAIAERTERRYEEILAQDKSDNSHAIRELEKRIEKAALAAIELLFPPPDSPVEVLIAARNRLAEMKASEIATLYNNTLRTLAETGRHRRLLAGESTAIFERAGLPDVLIPLTAEAAQALELQSISAQQALNAQNSDGPIDIAGELIPPSEADSAYSPIRLASPSSAYSPSVSPAVSPVRRFTHDHGVDVGL